MNFIVTISLRGIILATAFLTGNAAFAHGDVAPQAVDTTGLEPLGDEWLTTNPYLGNEKAIEIGKSGYGANCARCHGLEAISGGIAPDLRYLEPGEFGDEWYIERVRNGVIRNDVTYMPPFEGILSQEAMWAIRAWLETVYEEQ